MRTSAVLAAVMLSGCSLLGTRRPDPPPYQARPDCNGGYARPVTDAAIGSGGLAVAALGAFTIARPVEGPDDNGKDGVGAMFLTAGVAVAGLFITSAVIGFPRVNACAEVLAEWDAAHPNEKPEGAEERLARQYLRCPLDHLATRDLESWPPESHAWAAREIQGCGRVAWCGDHDGGKARCGAPPDLEFAVRQLAIETGCPAQTIEQLEFYGIETQNTYRMNACGIQFSCLVPVFREKGRGERVAGSVFGSQLTCKPAQTLTKPALQPETPGNLEPPPPPPSQP